MRKRIIGTAQARSDVVAPIVVSNDDTWLDLENIAAVEVSSEDPAFPVEAIFDATAESGWRAAEDGEQLVRIIFDEPAPLHRIQVQFVEKEIERTQQFTLRWSQALGAPAHEIVRQQWTFSPQGSTREVEQYAVSLEGVAVLELSIRPDLNAGRGRATLLNWRVG
jgi:hypothetical protein